MFVSAVCGVLEVLVQLVERACCGVGSSGCVAKGLHGSSSWPRSLSGSSQHNRSYLASSLAVGVLSSLRSLGRLLLALAARLRFVGHSAHEEEELAYRFICLATTQCSCSLYHEQLTLAIEHLCSALYKYLADDCMFSCQANTCSQSDLRIFQRSHANLNSIN